MFSQLPRSPLPPSTPSVNSAWGGRVRAVTAVLPQACSESAPAP
jgi:hypothetical protein